MPRFSIRVRYPLARRSPGTELVLRSALDWERDVVPVRADGELFEFELAAPAERLFLDYKPCLRERGVFQWSVGDNYVTWSQDSAHEIYPRFLDAHGTLSPHFTVRSRAGAVYALRIYLPPGYEENTLKRYPTLYAHDGANAFVPEESIGQTPWDLDDTHDLLDTMSVIDKVIVVAIHARAGARTLDYTEPGFHEYARFLAEELVPAVDASFRTLTDARQRATLGSSLGGVVALHLAWSRPETFGKAACLSSSFGYHDDLFARIAREERRAVRLYLDSGWPRDNFETTRQMVQLLVQRGFTIGQDLVYFAFPLALHSERYWAARVHLPFQYLFGRAWNAPPA
jgi:predicted alpha/beta superfamily hydrolase